MPRLENMQLNNLQPVKCKKYITVQEYPNAKLIQKYCKHRYLTFIIQLLANREMKNKNNQADMVSARLYSMNAVRLRELRRIYSKKNPRIIIELCI